MQMGGGKEHRVTMYDDAKFFWSEAEGTIATDPSTPTEGVREAHRDKLRPLMERAKYY